jgi:hypothetical protein
VPRTISQYLKERAREAERQRAVQSLERLTDIRKKIEQRSGIYQDDVIAELELSETNKRNWCETERNDRILI